MHHIVVFLIPVLGRSNSVTMYAPANRNQGLMDGFLIDVFAELSVHSDQAR
jgi:hypothetical protein